MVGCCILFWFSFEVWSVVLCCSSGVVLWFDVIGVLLCTVELFGVVRCSVLHSSGVLELCRNGMLVV